MPPLYGRREATEEGERLHDRVLREGSAQMFRCHACMRVAGVPLVTYFFQFFVARSAGPVCQLSIFRCRIIDSAPV